MFTKMVFLIFFFDSSSFSFLLLTSLDEKELSRGVNPFENLLSSREIISFLFKYSFYKKAQILSSSRKTCQNSTFSRK
jgi:hypothetical protein